MPPSPGFARYSPRKRGEKGPSSPGFARDSPRQRGEKGSAPSSQAWGETVGGADLSPLTVGSGAPPE